MTKNNRWGRRLLAGIQKEIARLVALNARKLPGDYFAVAELRERIKDARHGIIALDLRVILGRALPNGSAEHRAVHRALDDLEARGIIERLRSCGCNTTHVMLVEE